MGKHKAADRSIPRRASRESLSLPGALSLSLSEVHSPSLVAAERATWSARPLLSLGGRSILVFRDKLERAAEDSEAGLAALGAIVQELMAQAIAALAAGHL